MHELFEKANILDEWDSFKNGFSSDWKRAWRFQKSKASAEDIAKLFAEEFDNKPTSDYLKEVPWSSDGYYIPNKEKLGRSLAYALGLIYIQEASAMLPAEVLNAKPGEKILDLCAAPGGKSSQTASKLNGEGLLIANDISEARARILSHNIELQGFKNTIVTSFDTADGLPKDWSNYFDAIQLDVPCSSEGMFRRDKTVMNSWAEYGPNSIIPTQMQLLESASTLVKAGGRIVYSTCTFNSLENEEIILDFLERHPEFSIVDPREYLPSIEGLRPGIAKDGNQELTKAIRIWPQDGMGEGHFCALLVKSKDADVSQTPDKILRVKKNKKSKNVDSTFTKRETKEACFAFAKAYIKDEYLDGILNANDKRFIVDNERLYLLPEEYPSLTGLKVIKEGCYLGDIKKGSKKLTFIPSRDFLMQSDVDSWKYVLELDYKDIRVQALLKGETLVLNESETYELNKIYEQAYIVVTVNGLPLTWTKKNMSTLKNLYPQNLLR